MALVLSAAASKPTREGQCMAGRVRVSWEGGSHAVLFMVPLGPPSARPVAQVLRLPFVLCSSMTSFFIYDIEKYNFNYNKLLYIQI